MADKRLRNAQHAVFFVRIVLGASFAMGGLNHLFDIGSGGGLAQLRSEMAGLEIWQPAVCSVALAVAKLICGLALVLGFLHRASAALAVALAVGAILMVRARQGWFLPSGFEHHLALVAMGLAVWLAGPGSFAYQVEFSKNEEKR